MSGRLTTETLGALPADVVMPAYDRADVATGIVHLGIGAFHRAHQAAYFEQLLASGDRRWGIVGVSLRSPAVAEQLNPQDGLYTLVTRGGEGDALAVIGAVQRVLVAGRDSVAIIALMADPAVHIISLTVTEKGYCHDPATGALRRDHDDIIYDLANPAAPRSAIGLLCAGLAARRAAMAGSVTVLSCDICPTMGRCWRGW